jgi:hypothetical protein
MKILKKFDSYIKEDLEPQTMPDPSTSPSTAPTIDPGTRPARPERPSPIRRDRPAVEPDPQANMIDYTEEEESDDVYFGKKMMDELAEALGTEVVNNVIEYNGKKINFYSETEKFHVDKKKFSTVEEVLDYLGEGEPSMETEMMEDEEEKAKRQIDNSDEGLWEEDDEVKYTTDHYGHEEEEEEEIIDNLENESWIKWPKEEVIESRITKKFNDFK